jgi:sugar phosphate isomerase/epimerase
MNKPLAKGNALNRRHFLSTSGMITAALAASGSMSRNLSAAETTSAFGTPKKTKIGLELYSVRGEMGKDLTKTLNEVGKMGYEVVEFYSAYFGWKPAFAKDVRTQLDDLGMRCLSTHNGFESYTPGEKMAHAIELNQILGCRYIVLAGAPNRPTDVDGWKKLCEKFTAASEEFKAHGLKGGYHNHQSEWAKLENGQRIMEVMAANTPADFALQLDVGTCEEAGVDPVAWVKANPGRIKMMHLKDWAPNKDGSKEKGYRVLFCEGVTPWKELIAAGESVGGAEFFLIEQEGSRFSEFETAKRCLNSWKSMMGRA